MKDLSHVDSSGRAGMVDVSGKPESDRRARASGCIRMSPDTLAAIKSNALAKGDVIAVARLAGVMAAKKTSEIIPLCHPLQLSNVQVTAIVDDSIPGIRVEAEVRCHGRTGVEMEALVAVSAALLTVYDMAKSMDRMMEVSRITLDAKEGGRSGSWHR
jgi:cyclic pyranopterin phosphate synthase